MADNLDEVFSAPLQAEEPVAEPSIENQEPQAEALPPEPVEPEAKPIVNDEPQQRDQMVPLAALLDDRDKRKAIAEERDRYKRELEDMRATQQPQQVPDALDDPNGYNDYVRTQIAEAVQRQKVDTSWHLAIRDHGRDTVEAAKQWALERAQQDPIFRSQVDQAFQVEALPIDWVVQQHKRDGLVSQIGDAQDMDAFVRNYIQQNPGKFGQTAPVSAAIVDAAPKQASPPAKVPRSLAGQGSAPSDIRQTATGPLAGVDALFG